MGLMHASVSGCAPVRHVWIGIGFLGQAVFASRFLDPVVQSELAGRSVIPIAFWYFSLGGGCHSLTYAIHLVGLASPHRPGRGLIVYARNLYLIYREKAARSPPADFREACFNHTVTRGPYAGLNSPYYGTSCSALIIHVGRIIHASYFSAADLFRVIIYNLIALGGGVVAHHDIQELLARTTIASRCSRASRGKSPSATSSLFLALALLFIEIIKATRTTSREIINHGLVDADLRGRTHRIHLAQGLCDLGLLLHHACMCLFDRRGLHNLDRRPPSTISG